MEQMSLVVSSSLRQQQQNNEKRGGPGARDTAIPPMTATDAYYYQDSRKSWSRIIIGIAVGLFGGLFLIKSGSPFHRKPPSTHLSSSAALDAEYDYIIVGSGPSGITAATKLARRLPTARIVLLESGSVSQSAVVESLKYHRNETVTSTTGSAFTAIDPSGRTQQRLQPIPTLNKYDIPLMWSGIANTQRRTQSFQLTPDPQSSTYWPIPLALLARGLGGCGLHNAM